MLPPFEYLVYQYRKTFGLSYQEFLEEPADVFSTNVLIMSEIARFKKAQDDRMARRAKSR